ncbi:hypothetical protein EB796_013308 [Bugula neritina]|uniref:Uncharacterized protein n=1 Tax=Bugula neritina TaxID=10212 RepID=A0A7J7JPZ1_BUGNE|nr:hypothetical protein EB796_013308 [Bugula neritina]
MLDTCFVLILLLLYVGVTWKAHKKLIKKFNRYLMTGQLNVTETEAAADQPAKVSAKPSQSKHGSTQSSQSGDGKIPPKHVKKGQVIYTNYFTKVWGLIQPNQRL